MIFLCDVISGPIFVIDALLSHVKVTDAGISRESFGIKWFPFGVTMFRWQDVSSVEIRSDGEMASGIKKIVVTGYYRGQVAKITVPGHLPDVNLIVEEIRKYVPDKVRENL